MTWVVLVIAVVLWMALEVAFGVWLGGVTRRGIDAWRARRARIAARSASSQETKT